MAFDPERDGLHLRQAIMKSHHRPLADLHAAMVELHRRGVGSQPPEWWFPQLAPAPERWGRWPPHYDDAELLGRLADDARMVETMFFHDLYGGKITCWARPGAVHAEYVEIPDFGWAHLAIADWASGDLVERDPSSVEHINGPTLGHVILKGWKLVAGGARYYGARIVPLGIKFECPPKNKGGRPAAIPPVVSAGVAAWLAAHGAPERQADLEKVIHDLLGDLDREAAPSTVREYASTAIKEFRRQMGGGEVGN